MSENENTTDAKAMSPASDGSVGWRSSVDIRVRLRAWRDNPHFRALGYGGFWTKAADDISEAADEIARLRLTDAEREAIERLCEATNESIADDKQADGCHWQDDAAAVAVVRGLLERLG